MPKHKRYHHHKSHAHHEHREHEKRSRGTEEYREKEMYAGSAMRERMEYDSSMMIQENHSAMANLPQEVMMKYYPSTAYQNENVPDTIRSIDVQIRDDMKHHKKGNYPEKY